MRWTALSLVAISVACAGRSWQETPVVADLSVPQSCQSDLAPIWTDSLPIVADSTQQHLIAGREAIQYPADVRQSRAAVVRARFAIDTAGRVVKGSGIIEASSDELFAQAVCSALPRLRFEPVIRDGHKVIAGFVHVPFTFSAR